MGKLNPKISVVDYGKKEMDTLTLYPLSIKDQFDVSQMVADFFIQISEVSNNNQVIHTAIDYIKENLATILSKVADITEQESEDVLSKMTNDQLCEVVDVIWTVNYEGTIKNGRSLFERMKNLFPSKRPLQTSLQPIPNTPSTTSTEEVIETEE